MNAPARDDWSGLCAAGFPVEQAVIGACLVYWDAIDGAIDTLTADDFAEPAHRLLFGRMADARREGRRLDVGLLRAALAERVTEDLGGLTLGEYIGRLVAEAPAAIGVRETIRALRDFADYRRLFCAAEDLRERAARGMAAGAPKNLAIEAIQSIDSVVANATAEHLRRVTAGQAGEAAIAKMNRARAGEKEGWGAPYGVAPLDQMTRGMHRGHLTIVAARPSMGKSAFAVCAALAAAKANHATLFVSLEMSAEELAERSMASLAFDRRDPIPYVQIRSGMIDDDQALRLSDATAALDRIPLIIERQPGLSPGQIVTRSRAAAQLFGRQDRKLGVVIVDHLGKVRPSDRYAGNRTTELGEITGALKDMAGELDCAVVALCQLNRQTENRDNKRPTLADLRESGRIEEDADNVLLLYREAYYQERTKQNKESDFDRQIRIGEVAHDLEIIVAKQRQGATGVIDAWCDMPCNVITGKG